MIVVDNNSTDDSRKVAAKHTFVTVIAEDRQGIIYARNAGFAAAGGDILARLDADSRIPEDWVEQIVDYLQAHQQVAAVTGRPDFYNVAFSRFFNAAQVLLYQRLQRALIGTHCLWGANMALRRESWLAIAGSCSLREDIDEDIDLTLCLRAQKRRVGYLPRLRVGASLQRGNWDFAHTVRYLASWPRDYLLHDLRLRAVMLYGVVAMLLVARLPLLLVLKLTSKTAG